MSLKDKTYTAGGVHLFFGVLIFSLIPAGWATFICVVAHGQPTAAYARNVLIIGGLSVLFLSLPLLLVLARWQLRVHVQKDGITIRTLRRGTEFFPWSDVKRVERGVKRTKVDNFFTLVTLSNKRRILFWDVDFADAQELAENLAGRLGQPVTEPPEVEPDPDFTGRPEETKAWKKSDALMLLAYLLAFASFINLDSGVRERTGISSWWPFGAAVLCVAISILLSPRGRSK